MTLPIGPPRRAEYFAAALIAEAALRDAVLGDMTEEHHRLTTARSAAVANRWYRGQLLRSAWKKEK